MKIKIFTWLSLVVIFLSGCSIKDKLASINGDEATPASSVFADQTYAEKLNDKVPLHLYFGSNANTGLAMEVRYIPIVEAKKSIQNLASCIVKEITKGPSSDSSNKKILPEGTQMIGTPVYKDGLITINFNKNLIEKMTFDDTNMERNIIFSVVNSLTEVKEIERVKFLIEGKTQKDYKGKLKLDSVFPRNPSLINVGLQDQAAETIEVLD